MFRHPKASPDLCNNLEPGLNSWDTNVLRDAENDSEYEVEIFQLEQHNLL